jgi:NAD(P)-dependent dehydrogenase (short-subunit alcohol dehydrogenase family)
MAFGELGRLDIVVANAGVVALGIDVPVLSFIDTISINLGGVFDTVEAAFPHLEAGRLLRHHRLQRCFDAHGRYLVTRVRARRRWLHAL